VGELRPASLGGEAGTSISVPKSGLHTSRSLSTTAIYYGNATRDQPSVSAYTEGVLRDIIASAGIERIQILSAYRTVEEQARFMYRAMHHVRPTFTGHAAEVEIVAKSMVGQIQVAMAAGSEARQIPTPADILKRMADVIDRLERRHGPLAISPHRQDPSRLAVLNIGVGVGGSMQRAALLRRLLRSPAISRVGAPRLLRGVSRGAFSTVGQWVHIEIPQK